LNTWQVTLDIYTFFKRKRNQKRAREFGRVLNVHLFISTCYDPKRRKGIAKTIPIITRRTIATIQPIIQVKIAFPVEKSRACLTATTIAINPQTHTAKEINPPKIGIKLKNCRTPGELENPSVRRSSATDAVPPNTLVPTK